MSEYTPSYVGTVTKYVFVESPTLTPGDLAVRAYEVAEGVMIKETCFGLQVTGKPEEVERVIAHLRTFDPAHIFVKDRGFPPGDPRRCRANLGGARPGFHGHEYELSLIRHVSAGLEEQQKGVAEKPQKKCVPGLVRLDAEKLKRMMEEEEPCHG